jgi:hypothetical protein
MEWTLANAGRHNTTTKTHHVHRPNLKTSTSKSDLQSNPFPSSPPHLESTWCPPIPTDNASSGSSTQPGREADQSPPYIA